MLKAVECQLMGKKLYNTEKGETGVMRFLPVYSAIVKVENLGQEMFAISTISCGLPPLCHIHRSVHRFRILLCK